MPKARYGIFRYHPQRDKVRRSFPSKVYGVMKQECRESANKWFSTNEGVSHTHGNQICFASGSDTSSIFKDMNGMDACYEIRLIQNNKL